MASETQHTNTARGGIVPAHAALSPATGAHPALPQPSGDMRELRRRVQEAGLLAPRARSLVTRLVVTAVLLVASIAFLVAFHGFWGIVVGALLLGIVWVQLAFIVHDVGHRQGFVRRWQNALVGIICGDLLVGGSYGWWVKKHNLHHAYPNDIKRDPDMLLPLFALTPTQARDKRGVLRVIVRYQLFLAVPLLTLLGYGQRIASYLFVLRERSPYRRWEAVALAVNAVAYIGVPLYLLGPWSALLLIVIHQAVTGVYLGLVFAPNHIGMALPGAATPLDPVRAQVLTSRNLLGSPVIDWLYGGLNYQIEHHLFPSMTRSQLGKAAPIVRAYCQERGIAYYETGVVQAYVEILRSLRAAAAPLRAGPGRERVPREAH